MNEREGRLVAETALDALGTATERVIDGKLLAVQVTLVLRDRDGGVCVMNTLRGNGDGSVNRVTVEQ
jgi:hypothetical protein